MSVKIQTLAVTTEKVVLGACGAVGHSKQPDVTVGAAWNIDGDGGHGFFPIVRVLEVEGAAHLVSRVEDVIIVILDCLGLVAIGVGHRGFPSLLVGTSFASRSLVFPDTYNVSSNRMVLGEKPDGSQNQHIGNGRLQ